MADAPDSPRRWPLVTAALIAVRPLALHGSLAITGGVLAVAATLLAIPAAAGGRLLSASRSASQVG